MTHPTTYDLQTLQAIEVKGVTRIHIDLPAMRAKYDAVAREVAAMRGVKTAHHDHLGLRVDVATGNADANTVELIVQAITNEALKIARRHEVIATHSDVFAKLDAPKTFIRFVKGKRGCYAVRLGWLSQDCLTIADRYRLKLSVNDLHQVRDARTTGRGITKIEFALHDPRLESQSEARCWTLSPGRYATAF
jgi:hypothetical protein